jgi:endo-1,4-beta-xylanase
MMVSNRAASKVLLLVGGLVLLALPTGPAASEPTPCRTKPASSACELKFAARRSGVAIGASIAEGVPQQQRLDIESHFTSVTDENAFKWSSMETTAGEVDFSNTDALVDWAWEADLRLRAHVLFWHRMQTPGWVRSTVADSTDPRQTLIDLMTDRVAEVVERYRGRIAIYDVVNEPLETFGPGWDETDSIVSPKNFFYTTLGEEYIDLAFEAAHEADPGARLAINETVWNPKVGDPKADAFLALVGRLIDRGVPIDSVGLQTHGMFGLEEPYFPGSTESFREYIDAIGRLGVTVELTELDVALPFLLDRPDPLAAQAGVYERAVLACSRSRFCSGVTTWNIRDDDTWLDSFWATASRAPNRPLLLDPDGNQKPAYGSVRDALLERCRQRWALPGPWLARPCSPHWPYLSPRLAKPDVRWTVRSGRRIVRARVSSPAADRYAISVSRTGKFRRGKCASTLAARAFSCRIRLARGRWKVAIRPMRFGTVGTPSTRRVVIR